MEARLADASTQLREARLLSPRTANFQQRFEVGATETRLAAYISLYLPVSPHQVRALLLAGARRSVKSEGTRQTALMTAFAEGHKRVMDEFYDARSALARQRPPLLALEGSDAKVLGVGVGVGVRVVDGWGGDN